MNLKDVSQHSLSEHSNFDADEPIDSELVDSLSAVDVEPSSPASDAGLAPEPMFSALLRQAAAKLWGDDPVMTDFVMQVAPNLSELLGHVAAKGGDFVEQMKAAGKNTERYGDDQSMRSHLVNGLFPVLHVSQTLQRWGAPQFRRYDDTVRRIFIAGYVLHDWLKLPQVEAELEAAGVQHDTVNAVQHLEIVEGILRAWCGRLGLDKFLDPIGGAEALLHDLIYIACNTQIKWGTLRNLAALPKLALSGTQLDLAEQLSRLADLLAYVGRNPRDVVTHQTIHREISTLSDQRARFVYHHVADVRGVLTNFIHNVALDVRQSDECVPLLYAPSGVVYLARKQEDKFVPNMATVAEAVVERVRLVGGQRLRNSLTGFSRDGKGLKHAQYYTLFFNNLEMFDVAVQASAKLIHSGKDINAGKRYAKLATDEWLSEEADLDLPDDYRVDQLAEWCYMAEKIGRNLPGRGSVPKFLMETMGLDDLYADFLNVPRDTRAGGVGFHWYFVAGHYLKRNPGMDPAAWTERIAQLSRGIKTYLTNQHPTEEIDVTDDGFDDLRAYVQQILTFGPIEAEQKLEQQTPANDIPSALFRAELNRYSNAKKRGRGTTAMCTLCSSPFTVSKQREPASLFTPQVYSNKMALHGSSASRDICTICGLETMLRQLLMNRSDISGGNFEGQRLRYLFFYPTYFFTPETLEVFRILHKRLSRVRFTEMRRQLIEGGDEHAVIHLDPATWQRLEPIMTTPEEQFDEDEDRYLRMHFPENEPVTFYFIGVPPPSHKAKEAEAWVHPAFLALLLPLCTDVKVVASESQMPLMGEADELSETVLFDGAHAAIRYLVKKDRINIDELLPTLNRLVTAYLIHLDGNSGVGSGGFDYRWQDLPALARRLSDSPLYAFWYLKKWQRAAKVEAIPMGKARLYLEYYKQLSNGEDSHEGGVTMSHARNLTELYWQFYRARRPLNSNRILRPISVASKTIMDADRRLFDQDGLTEAVRGELQSFIDRVVSGRADGRLPRGSDREQRAEAIAAFADYFVKELFYGALNGDLSALRGKQINLLKSACEVLYRDLDAQYWADRSQKPEEDSTEVAVK